MEGLWEEHLARFKKKEVNQNAVIGGRVCRIDEAEEPSDIIWENIDTTLFQRYLILGQEVQLRARYSGVKGGTRFGMRFGRRFAAIAVTNDKAIYIYIV